MKKSKSYRPVTFTSSQILAIRLLLVVAFGIASYLAWASFRGGPVAGCGIDSGCDKVLQSRWAYWMGIPVSVPAMAVYGALFAVTFAFGRPGSVEQRWVPMAAGGLAVAILGGALWFVGLQAIEIRAYCRVCLAAHAAGAIAAVIVLNHLAKRVRAAAAAGAAAAAPARLAFGRAILAGVGALAILIAGQFAMRPEGYRVSALPGNSGDVAPPPRVFPIHGGQFQLQLNELPMIGPPTAPHVIVSLFDYTCHYCRDLHELLVRAQQQSSNQLAVVTLPMPLDANCNYLMKRTPPAHANACEYARIGLAVWRAKPEAFRQFDSWVFAPATPPGADAARRYAEELVGKENLNRALADPWIANQIRTDVAIFQANNQVAGGGGRMPQLIAGQAIVTGPVPRMENLQRLLQEQLGLKLDASSSPPPAK